MSTNKSFNICEKCGATNPLSAKFCFQCGNALPSPSQPVQCERCGTANSSVARYCKFCGKPLFKEEYRTCPRCHNTVKYDAIVCDKCHFRMPIVEEQGEKPLPMLQQNPDVVQTTTPVNLKSKYTSKSLVGNIVYCVLALLLVYLALGIPAITPQFLLNTGIFDYALTEIEGTSMGGLSVLSFSFTSLINGSDVSVYTWLLLVNILLMLGTEIMMFIINLSRIINSVPAKSPPWFYLGVFVVTLTIELIYPLNIGIMAYLLSMLYAITFALYFVFKPKQEKVQELHR